MANLNKNHVDTIEKKRKDFSIFYFSMVPSIWTYICFKKMLQVVFGKKD